jgi:hypothetical protein
LIVAARGVGPAPVTLDAEPDAPAVADPAPDDVRFGAGGRGGAGEIADETRGDGRWNAEGAGDLLGRASGGAQVPDARE